MAYLVGESRVSSPGVLLLRRVVVGLPLLQEAIVLHMESFVALTQLLDEKIWHLRQVLLGNDRVVNAPRQLLQLDGFTAVIQAAGQLIEIHGIVEVWNVHVEQSILARPA